MHDSEGRVSLNGQKIKLFRKQMCLSQKLLVERCQSMGGFLAIATLKRAESEKMVLYRTARDIAMALGTDICNLLLKPLTAVDFSAHEITDTSLAIQGIIGRASQLRQSKNILQTTKEFQKGHVIYLRGAAGVGKTHFINTLSELAQTENFAVCSLAIFESSTTKRDILQELVKQLISKLGHNDQDSTIDLHDLFQKENFTDEQESYIYSLLDISNPNQSIQDKSHYSTRVRSEVAILVNLITKLNAAVTIIIDDIHWADDSLLIMLNTLTAEIRTLPVALVLSSRVKNDPFNKVWKCTVLNTPFSTLDLPPLSDAESKEMTKAYVGIPENYREQCLALVQGNPLFLKLLMKNFPHSLENIPETLDQLVKYKLQNLNESELKAIKIAAAIGHQFTLEAIKNIHNDHLFDINTLLDNYLIIAKANQAFQFSHDLIRKNIYNNLSQKQKHTTHQKIANFFKQSEPTLYAYHLRKANHNKAEQALQNAAEVLYEKHNYSDALTQVDLALSINPDKEAFSLIFLKGVLLKILDLPAKSTFYFEKALTLAGNNQDRLKVCLELTDVYAVNQRYERSELFLAQAEELAMTCPSKETQSKINKYRIHLRRIKSSMNSMSPLLQYSQPENLIKQLSQLNQNQSIQKNTEYSSEVDIAILHSTTGSLKELEAGVLQTTIMALEEINLNGGLLGARINYQLFDGESDELVFKKRAKEALASPKISTIFGSSTSSSRKQVKEVIEQNDALLVYPFQYEGLEESSQIAYIGPPPNLQALPAIDWLVAQDKQSFYFVGSDYIYPLVTNEILRDSIDSIGAQVSGEGYVPLGGGDFSAIIDEIKNKMPDTIVLTLVGLDSNKEFLRQFFEAGLSHQYITVLSLVLSENDLCEIPIEHSQGIYSLFSYFQNCDNAVNDDFVRQYQARYGHDQRIGGYMESAYVGVQLWAQAVQNCQSFEPQKVIEAMKGISHYGPGGIAYMDETNQHVWRYVRIAKVGLDGEYHVIWNSDKPIAPEPFPPTRTPEEWSLFLHNLQQRWGGQWEKQN
jgi:urea transport system substrate-binding protein